MSSARSSSIESQNDANVKRKRTDDTEEELLAEEPVLSHAERRRRKKEQKLVAKLKEEEGSESATKKRKLKDGSAKSVVVPMKRQNSVWIGNMSFKTTQEALRTFFGDVGEITRINMPTKRTTGPGSKPENRGYVHSTVCNQISHSYSSLDLRMSILRLRKQSHWPLLYQNLPL